MNKNRYINISALFFLFFIFGVQTITGCKKTEAEIYGKENALYFPNNNGQDTLNLSFSHYPGMDKLVVEFEIGLIGNFITEDKEYKVKVVDTLTSAVPAEYNIISSKFKTGVEKDIFQVELIKSQRMSSEAVKLVLEIEENDNFIRGYFNKLTVMVTYNNIQSQPKWWNEDIEDTYLGIYSEGKLAAFIKATGKTSLEELDSWVMRELCLITKDYIAENGLTENDGSPMEIPCF